MDSFEAASGYAESLTGDSAKTGDVVSQTGVWETGLTRVARIDFDVSAESLTGDSAETGRRLYKYRAHSARRFLPKQSYIEHLLSVKKGR